MSTNPIIVSIIVPAYNASATIGKTLWALSRQNCVPPSGGTQFCCEVIVVDDGSGDHTGEIVRSFVSDKFEIKYVRQDNAGPAAARNHGAALASGGFLAFTDSDCVPHTDWIAQLMEGFKQPHVGAVAGSYGIANPESLLSRCIYQEILWRHKNLMPDFPCSFGSYNVCVKKNVFDSVGGFNTAYRHASGEDNDLSYKITRSGVRIYFQRLAIVDHYHPTRLAKYLKEQYRHGLWRALMYKDHPRMMRGDGYTFWKDIVEILLACFCLLALALSFTGFLGLGHAWILALPFFLAFEFFCTLGMLRGFLGGIFFGFICFFRAFARMFGLSTGIFHFLFLKKEKIFH